MTESKSDESEDRQLKLVFIGDCGVGKSSIIKRFLTDQFEEKYTPTNSIGELTSSIKVNSNIVKLVIWDISGKGINMTPDFATKVFPTFDVFYIVFSCDSKESYETAKGKWIELVEPHMKEDSLLIYVASKADLWDEDELDSIVTSDEIEEVDALECSALENEGVRAVFHSALRWALNKWETSVDNTAVVREYLTRENGILEIIGTPSQLVILKQLIRQEDEEVTAYFDAHINNLIDIVVGEEHPVAYSSSVCDLFTNHIRLLGKLVDDNILTKIFASVGREFEEKRRGTLILRLLNFLFVNHRSALIEYIQENKVMTLLIQSLNENVIDFITNVLEILKQQKSKNPELDIELLKSEELSPILCSKMENITSLPILTQLLSGIQNVGESVFLSEILLTNESSFLHASFKLLADKSSDALDHVIALFMEFIFPIVGNNKSDPEFLSTFGTALSEYESLIYDLLDGSILIVFYGAQLCFGLSDACPSLVPFHLISAVSNLLYKYPRSSTLHLLISESISNVIRSGENETSRSFLEDKTLFIEKMISELTDDSGETKEYTPHLVGIVKTIQENEYAKNILSDYEPWTTYISENWESLNTVPGSDAYTPSSILLMEKERQMSGPRGGRMH